MQCCSCCWRNIIRATESGTDFFCVVLRSFVSTAIRKEWLKEAPAAIQTTHKLLDQEPSKQRLDAFKNSFKHTYANIASLLSSVLSALQRGFDSTRASQLLMTCWSSGA